MRRGPGCWLWTGTSAPNGQRERYGLFRVGPTKIGAHRVAYALAYGPPAPGLLVCHSCDTPLCVRPDHLVAGTHQDNADDMRAKGRSPVRAGEANPSARLTLAAVREIRESTVPRGELAARFGVTPDHITRIRSRRRWVVASGG